MAHQQFALVVQGTPTLRSCCAGHTNSFHIQTQTPLAQRYNDMSVMENHHCALTFAILAKRDCAILSHLEKPLRQVQPCPMPALSCPCANFLHTFNPGLVVHPYHVLPCPTCDTTCSALPCPTSPALTFTIAGLPCLDSRPYPVQPSLRANTMSSPARSASPVMQTWSPSLSPPPPHHKLRFSVLPCSLPAVPFRSSHLHADHFNTAHHHPGGELLLSCVCVPPSLCVCV